MKPLLLGLALIGSPQTPAQPQAEITTHATGQVRVAPDLASVVLGLDLRDSSAAAVATSVGVGLQAVLDTLDALGYGPEEVGTSEYYVSPAYRYQGDERVVDGYEAKASVRVEIRNLADLGRVIDAGLTAGANDVRSISFEVQEPGPIRQRALRLAMERARIEATTLAEAAGGRLGPLIEVSTVDRRAQASDMLVMQQGFLEIPAPVPVREVVITANVIARWRLER